MALSRNFAKTARGKTRRSHQIFVAPRIYLWKEPEKEDGKNDQNYRDNYRCKDRKESADTP